MNASEYIARMCADGLLSDTYHCEYVECGTDIDTVTCHAIVRVVTNDCAALIEVLQRCQKLGITLSGMHHLRAQFASCIEIDLVTMQRRTRKPRPTREPNAATDSQTTFDS